MVFWHLVKKMSLIRDNQSILNTLPTNWRTSWLGILDLEQQGLSAHGLKSLLSLIVQPPQQKEFKKKNFFRIKEDPKSSDSVNAIDYSSGLRGQRTSWLTV